MIDNPQTGRGASRIIRDESLRILLVILAALWAVSPLMTRCEVGAGDAQWYEYQVADAVTQFRAGVFPVYTGQSIYAFNGAIHPLRTAPYLQYFAGLIDVLTGRHLSPVMLLHLTAILSFVAGSLVCYLSLVWISPGGRWRAAGLAAVYIWAPGVLGLPFAQDLYMSTMAVPWVPLALAAAFQMYRVGGYRTAVVLGGSLGILWWAHSPIAFWTTLAAGVVSLGGIVAARPEVSWLKQAALAATIFGLVASYPVVSVVSLRDGHEKIVPKIHGREDLLREVAGAFPGVVQPLSLERPLLDMMQPGYVALAILFCAAISIFWAERRTRLGLFLSVALAVGYLVLMWPVPGLTAAIWNHIPELVANMTNIWPMQRLAGIVVALAIVAWTAVASADGAVEAGERKTGLWLMIGMLAWAGWQADVIRELAHHQTHSMTETDRALMPENVNVSAYCYQQLPARPAYFIHGVTDPEMQLRLLDPSTGELVESNLHVVELTATDPWLSLDLKQTENPVLWRSVHPFTLRPGRRYLLTFDFSSDDRVAGILRLTGQSMQRVYALPEAGDAKGFGIGAGHEKSIAVWTSQSTPETVRLEFINQEADSAGPLRGRVRLSQIDADQLPVRLESLIPFRSRLRLKQPSLLETPRMYVPGWRAVLDGKEAPVERSREGLVAIKVPAGESRVTLSYHAPLRVRASFWTSLLSIVVLFAGLLITLVSNRPRLAGLT